jgi:hypothetical protein
MRGGAPRRLGGLLGKTIKNSALRAKARQVQQWLNAAVRSPFYGKLSEHLHHFLMMLLLRLLAA